MPSKGCKLHEFFNSLARYKYPFDIEKIPENGIYVMFENGEKYFDFDRIVFVGTHIAENRLIKRLKEHFCNNKSVLRRKIGCALLNRTNDEFWKSWNVLSFKNGERKNCSVLEKQKLDEVNNQVTDFIRDNLSFSVIPNNSVGKVSKTQLQDSGVRKRLKKGIISILYHDDDFKSSDNWLGQFSPDENIKNSGLWLDEFYEGASLSDGDVNIICG